MKEVSERLAEVGSKIEREIKQNESEVMRVKGQKVDGKLTTTTQQRTLEIEAVKKWENVKIDDTKRDMWIANMDSEPNISRKLQILRWQLYHEPQIDVVVTIRRLK